VHPLQVFPPGCIGERDFLPEPLRLLAAVHADETHFVTADLADQVSQQ